MCPHCDDDLLQQAKLQLANGHHAGAIGSARCYVGRHLRDACIDMDLFKKGRQKTYPNLTSMVWRLAEAGAVTPAIHDRFISFARMTAVALDGGPDRGASRAWKAIREADYLISEFERQLSRYRQDQLLADQAQAGPSQPDTSANL